MDMASMMAAMAGKMGPVPPRPFVGKGGKGGGGGASGWSAEKQALVQRVKDFQQSGFTEKKQWEVFCQMKKVQRYDPGSHNEDFLNEFFLMQQSGQISADKHDTPQKLELVEKVKAIQKSSPVAKQMWYDYCEAHGNINYDPARHEETYLATFIEKMEKGGHGASAPVAEANKIFVGALETTITEDDVREFFSNFGTVTLVELKMNPATGESRGFAFITFSDEAPVKFILENREMMKMHGKQIDCKPARDRSSAPAKGSWGGGGYDDFSWGKGKGKEFGKMAMMMSAMAAMMKGGKGGPKGGSKGPTGPQYGKGSGNPTADSEVIFVGGLPRDATEESIYQHFSQFGTVQKVDMKYDPTTLTFRGFAFVTLGSVAEAQAIFSNYDNNMFNGKWIDCKPAALGKMAQMSGGDGAVAVSLPPTNIPADKVSPPPTGNTLRARGLPFSATKEQVLEFFNGYGVTGRVHLKQDFSGRPSGEVFVEFASNDEAIRAFHDRNFQMMGNRYVELMGATDKDVQTYLDNNGKGGGYGPMMKGGGKGRPSPYDLMGALFGF